MLLEDIGAEIGLFFALVGVILAQVTDDPRWDAVGSIAIGVLLVVIAIVLAIEMKGLLIGESASRAGRRADRSDACRGARRVRRLIHLRTEHLGPDELLVGGQAGVRARPDRRELAEAIDSAETRLRAAVPIARLIYIEPDVYRPAVADARRDGVAAAAAPTAPTAWPPTFAPIGILAMLVAVLVFSSSSTIVKWADTPGSVSRSGGWSAPSCCGGW